MSKKKTGRESAAPFNALFDVILDLQPIFVIPIEGSVYRDGANDRWNGRQRSADGKRCMEGQQVCGYLARAKRALFGKAGCRKRGREGHRRDEVLSLVGVSP